MLLGLAGSESVNPLTATHSGAFGSSGSVDRFGASTGSSVSIRILGPLLPA